jgi:hypothetical protein
MTTMLQTDRSSRRWRRRCTTTLDLDGGRAVMTNLSSLAEHFEKTLFALSWCGIIMMTDFRDLLSHLLVQRKTSHSRLLAIHD